MRGCFLTSTVTASSSLSEIWRLVVAQHKASQPQAYQKIATCFQEELAAHVSKEYRCLCFHDTNESQTPSPATIVIADEAHERTMFTQKIIGLTRLQMHRSLESRESPELSAFPCICRACGFSGPKSLEDGPCTLPERHIWAASIRHLM